MILQNLEKGYKYFHLGWMACLRKVEIEADIGNADILDLLIRGVPISIFFQYPIFSIRKVTDTNSQSNIHKLFSYVLHI